MSFRITRKVASFWHKDESCLMSNWMLEQENQERINQQQQHGKPKSGHSSSIRTMPNLDKSLIVVSSYDTNIGSAGQMNAG